MLVQLDRHRIAQKASLAALDAQDQSGDEAPLARRKAEMKAPSDVTKLRADPIPPMPDNAAAEQALLGAVLISNREYRSVACTAQPEDFAWAAHQRIFAAIGQLVEAGQPANPVTMAHLFADDEALRPLGGPQYLMTLGNCAITVSAAIDYAYLVADLALRRAPRVGSVQS